MAETAQFFEVTFEDINKKWSQIIPAKTKEALVDALNEKKSKHVNIVSVDWLEHHPVKIQPNQETDNVQFVATINGTDVCINEWNIGFDYLQLQFHKQVKEFNQNQWT